MWRDEAADILQDHWAESQKYNNLVLDDMLNTLIDSFIDDDPHEFAEIIDIVYEEVMDMPDGKMRMILTSCIDQLAALPIE